ncbi:MAG TPA: FAD-dependent tricarballylate dehydrogenase TcuA [Candidatus Binatia bacterium]|nr:FAD-dependent tricarballylate dehydrogenase TcuA [Candidatus Binatia bacterium]
MPSDNYLYDVLVIGGGNAALCAAITARRAGAGVLLLECASKDFRGGNSRHTRDVRYMHKRATNFVTGAYDEEEFWQDLLGVTGGATNEHLARLTIRESEDLGDWMPANGVHWQKPLAGTLHLTRSNLFMLGGGKAMMNAYYDRAAKLGVEICYESQVNSLDVREGEFISASAVSGGAARDIKARTTVVAAGGFEANISWLKEYWGDAAENFVIRGTPYNQGLLLKELLKHGAKPVGDPRGCHAVALDARAPKFDGGIVTRLDSVPFGIVVNREVKRFYDEGEDFWPKRYAIWGKLIAEQPAQIAYSIIDSKAMPHFIPSVFPPVEAGSIAELATALNIDPAALVDVVEGFNQSVRKGSFEPGILDNCHTEALSPPKSHWARPIDQPPFYGYPLRPGITFTYLGVTVNEQAQVILQSDQPAKNIFAAGEMMAGNILGRGYLAGFGLTIGSVFGRIAGREAARYALA